MDNTPHIIRKAVGGQFYIGNLPDINDLTVAKEIDICMVEACARLHIQLRTKIPRGKKHQYVPVTFRLIAEVGTITPVKPVKKGHKK